MIITLILLIASKIKVNQHLIQNQRIHENHSLRFFIEGTQSHKNRSFLKKAFIISVCFLFKLLAINFIKHV